MGVGGWAGKLRKSADRLLSRFEDPLEQFELARRRQLELLGDLEHRLLLAQPGTKEEANLLQAKQNLEGRIAEFQSIIVRLKASKSAGGADSAADRLEEEMQRLAEDARRWG
ncbi:hypothetical protein GCM10009839_73830 [Catenulispora yoronensis]|uniref:Uncharacterized protein n=1 Tax=Catenulispora yoronensis TaxID=450799 RepID=A0ABP5GUB6_9ACTN